MDISKHDAHASPPQALRALFKKWQKSTADIIDSDQDIIHTTTASSDDRLRIVRHLDDDLERIKQAFVSFKDGQKPSDFVKAVRCFEVKSLPGLFVYPSILTTDLQRALLDKLLHRDLSHPSHRTNLHLHYHMPNEPMSKDSLSLDDSFFNLDQEFVICPRDPSIHKLLSMREALNKKLRWVTLGGQYDWTQKIYPDEVPPCFPEDIARLLRTIFPSVDPQAAILNFYSPGHTLSLHRDVSEDCERGLISLSIGCDALFLVASPSGDHPMTLRLRSGDVVLMSGDSRYAWHAVPKVLPDTCPEELRSWPSTTRGANHRQWDGWLANKRINLNVRQMYDR